MDCKRVTVIRIGPVISTRTKALHKNVWCFFVAAKRVRVELTQESAVHGLQEGHRDQNRPGNLHQNESTTRKRVVLFCFICRSPYVPFHEKSVCRSPQAVTNAFYFTVRPSAF